MPERMQWKLPAILCAGKQRLWHDRKPTANTSEAAILGETAKFNRTLARAGDLED